MNTESKIIYTQENHIRYAVRRRLGDGGGGAQTADSGRPSGNGADDGDADGEDGGTSGAGSVDVDEAEEGR